MFWILLCVLVLLVVLNLVLPNFTRKRDNTVTFIVGQIGSGKSAYSVKVARNYIKHHRPVFATDYIAGAYKFDVAWLSSMRCPENSLLIIDEAALRFNSRDFAKISKDIIAYFKKCRHYHNDVILISQTFSDSDKQIREIATKVLFLRKFGFFTFPVRVTGDVTVDSEGQPAMKYRIGRFAKPFIPMLQGKYYNSWEDGENRPVCPSEPWDIPDIPDTLDVDSDASEAVSDAFSDVPVPSDDLLFALDKMTR